MAAMFAAVRMPRDTSLPRIGSNRLFVPNCSVPTRQKFVDAMDTLEKTNQPFQPPFYIKPCVSGESTQERTADS